MKSLILSFEVFCKSVAPFLEFDELLLFENRAVLAKRDSEGIAGRVRMTELGGAKGDGVAVFAFDAYLCTADVVDELAEGDLVS